MTRKRDRDCDITVLHLDATEVHLTLSKSSMVAQVACSLRKKPLSRWRFLHQGRPIDPDVVLGSLTEDDSLVLEILWSRMAPSHGCYQWYKTAFVAIRDGGSVVTWGKYADNGGDSTSVAERLEGGVAQISFSGTAIAAIKDDGSVVT